jgi:hypothetical protein
MTKLITFKCSLTDLIFTNTKIIDKSNHWSLILYQQSIAINRMKPFLTMELKPLKIYLYLTNRILLLHYIYLYICNIIIIHFLMML